MGEDGIGGGEAVVGALVGEVLVGPYLPHELDGLPEQFPILPILAWVRVGMELRTFIRPDAPAEAHLHASPGHVVQDRKVLGKPDRVPPRRDIRHLADADPRCPGREVRAEQDRIRYIADGMGSKVVFSEPDGLEAELLGQNGLLSEIIQQANGIGGFSRRGRDRRKGSEFHSSDVQPRPDRRDVAFRRPAAIEIRLPERANPSSGAGTRGAAPPNA